jgi:hypothetical protein
MKIEVKYYPENISIYFNDEKMGSVSYEVFMLRILSPKQLLKYEKNSEISRWDVRKIDLNYALTHQEQSIEYLYV